LTRVTVVVLVACALACASPDAQQQEPSMELSAQPGWSALNGMPHVVSRGGVPPGYVDARAAWERGERAWSNKQADEAAAAFE
jgi:hypothetical protein